MKSRGRSALSGWPMILGWLAMTIFAFHACTHMVGGGDTWVAIACGRHFFNHGVSTVEPFSTNSLKAGPTEKEIETWSETAQWFAHKVGLETVKYWHPTGWVNQDWLAHLIFYWLTHESPFADVDTLSFNSLVYWKFAIYVLTVICVYYTGRLLGTNPALCVVFACFTMFVGRSFFDIRPAGFTNLLVAVFLLVLVLATYRNILYIWLIIPLVVFWCNVHGGYIYAFIMLVPFTALNLLTSFFPKRFVSIGLKGVYHTFAAGLVAFLAVILFSPSHLTNLTHIFTIFLGRHAEQWLSPYEWHPAFEWKNPVGTATPFLVMCIIAWSVLPIWVIVLVLASRCVRRFSQRKVYADEYKLPKIDVALIVVAALTICMAIRSRRFIPIAAIATCPVVAMFIDQMICVISAVLNLYKRNHLAVSAMPRNLQLVFTFAGAVAVLTFGIWWGLKFKYVYLAPWPTDPKLTSLFIRMTASDAKPFYACKFIKDNKLEGKMFNDWTEGGFIAWGQQPDPNTGRIPLKLFIDSRAQRAYDPKIFELWSEIMKGGPTVQSARVEKRKLTTSDYTRIGQWANEQLKKHNVWVVLVPSRRSHTPFVRGLERNPDWQLVFFNNKQKLFVDTTSPRGLELFDGILNGKTLYPDDFSKNLVLAHNLLAAGRGADAHKRGLDFAIKAFELNPSLAPMQKIIFAAKFPELRSHVSSFYRDYLNDFTENKVRCVEQGGYHHRIVAASVACAHLRKIAEEQKSAKAAKFYATKKRDYNNERKRIIKSKRW